MFRRYSKGVSIILILTFVMSFFVLYAPESYASSDDVEYIAHRGWSYRAPENTLAAFRLAAKNKHFYGVELDVWEASYDKKTEDPLLLVMHDQNVYRMCGKNVDIRTISRKTLKKYKIKYGNNVSKYPGQRIPTIEQALDTIYDNKHGAIPVIELKHRLSKRALRYLLKYLDGRKAVIISFDFNAVSDAVKMADKLGISKNIKTMYLLSWISAGQYSSTIKQMKKADIDCVSIKYPYISKQTVKAFHKKKIKVSAWTLPNKATARAYADMGVDYITANGKVWN